MSNGVLERAILKVASIAETEQQANRSYGRKLKMAQEEAAQARLGDESRSRIVNALSAQIDDLLEQNDELANRLDLQASDFEATRRDGMQQVGRLVDTNQSLRAELAREREAVDRYVAEAEGLRKQIDQGTRGFVTEGDPGSPDSLINWRGANYVPQDAALKRIAELEKLVLRLGQGKPEQVQEVELSELRDRLVSGGTITSEPEVITVKVDDLDSLPVGASWRDKDGDLWTKQVDSTFVANESGSVACNGHDATGARKWLDEEYVVIVNADKLGPWTPLPEGGFTASSVSGLVADALS